MLLEQTASIDTHPLRWTDVPDPSPGPGQVRVRVRCCAICRTDLHVIEGDLPAMRRPIVPGHQVVGVVDQVGEGCVNLKRGDRAGIAWLRRTCGACEFCRSGRENLCEQARFTGWHAHGGYAEYAVVDEAFAYRIPPSFSDFDAAPLLCAGIIGYRAMARAEVRPGSRVALYGFGSSAHVVIQLALRRGCDVYVVTRGEGHRRLAREMGATWVGERASEMPVKVHSAIVFAPAGELVPAALEKLEHGGTLSLAGIHMTDVPPLDYEKHLFYERNVHSVTCNTRDDGRNLLAEAAAIPIRPHVTTYPLTEANRALNDLKNDRIIGTGVLVIDGTMG